MPNYRLWRFDGVDTLRKVKTHGPWTTSQGAAMAKKRNPESLKTTICLRDPEPKQLDLIRWLDKEGLKNAK